MNLRRDYLFVCVRGLSDLLDFVRGFLLISVLGGVFGSAIFGTWGLIEQIYSLGVILSGLGLGNAVVRYLAGERTKSYLKRSYVAAGFLITLAGILVTILFSIARPALAEKIIKTPEAYNCLLAALPLIIFNALELYLENCYRARLRINLHSVLRMVMVLFTIAVYLLAARLHYPLFKIISAILILKGIYILVLLILFYALECLGKSAEKKELLNGDFSLPAEAPLFATLKGMLSFGAPLMMFSLSAWLLGTGGKIFLGFQSGAGEVGRYDASLKLATLVQYLGIPIVYTLLPLLAEAVQKEGKASLGALCRRFSRLYFFFALPLIFGLLATNHAVLDLMTGRAEFLLPPLLFFLLLLGAFLGQVNIFFHNLIFLKGESRYLFVVNLSSALFCFLLNALFSRYGMWCTALSSLFSYLLLLLLLFFRTRKYGFAFGEILDLRFAAKSALSGGIMFLALYFASAKINLPAIKYLLAAGVSGALIYALVFLVFCRFSFKRVLLALTEGEK